MTAPYQPARIFCFVTVIATLFIATLMLADQASAAPIKAYGSIGSRVQSQTELCETLGGGTISVSYSYENGKMVSAQTSCKGGANNGWVCTNTAKTTDCYKVKTAPPSRTPMDVQGLPVVTVTDADIDVVGTPVGDVGGMPVLEAESSGVPVAAPTPVLVPMD